MKIGFYVSLIFSIFVLGIITYLTESEIMENILIVTSSCVIAILIFVMIIYPLFRWLFDIQGIKHYRIKKGKKYSSIMPIFKPYVGTKQIFFDINIVLTNYDLNFKTGQVNKLFGYNQGLPKLNRKTLTLIHPNSIRIGYIINGDNIQFVEYKRENGKILKYNVIRNVKLEKILNLYQTKTQTFTLITKGFGYILPRPYFGGSESAPCDMNFKYWVRCY